MNISSAAHLGHLLDPPPVSCVRAAVGDGGECPRLSMRLLTCRESLGQSRAVPAR